MYNLIHSSGVAQVARPLAAITGAVVGFLEPTLPFIFVCTLAILADCYTAWQLSRRVKRKHPGANDGKFKSSYAARVFITLIKVYVLIILAYLIEAHIFRGLPIPLSNIAAGAVCFWQLWSILENESSCNDAKWAKLAQRILIDKTERHFDVDLSLLKEEDKEGQGKEARDGKA